jgi:hypothetical protein
MSKRTLEVSEELDGQVHEGSPPTLSDCGTSSKRACQEEHEGNIPLLNLDLSLPNTNILSVHNLLGFNVPSNIKEKIVNGQYVDLELLLSNQPEHTGNKLSVNSQGEIILKPEGQKTKISDIESWTDAFIVFSSIYLSVHKEKQQEILKYMQNIRTGARRQTGMGWKLYDEQFRFRMASFPTECSFGKIDYELWLLYMGPQSNSGFLMDNFNAAKKCYDYNYRFCYKSPCTYRHSCLICDLNHPCRSCVTRKSTFNNNRWRAPGSQSQIRPNIRPTFRPRFSGPRFNK